MRSTYVALANRIFIAIFHNNTISPNITCPKVKLEQAWKQLLFNQLHDILPGSSMSQWQQAENTAAQKRSMNQV